MSRKAVIITLEELKKKLTPIIEGDEFPYDISAQITKDLSKVNFDFENWSMGPDHPDYPDTGFAGYPAGYMTLSNGLPVLFMNAGGDWENPICFCIYWDGKKLRAYIPSDGNEWNKKEMCAYGSEDKPEFDEDDIPEGDPEAIIQDVLKRIEVS